MLIADPENWPQFAVIVRDENVLVRDRPAATGLDVFLPQIAGNRVVHHLRTDVLSGIFPGR